MTDTLRLRRHPYLAVLGVVAAAAAVALLGTGDVAAGGRPPALLSYVNGPDGGPLCVALPNGSQRQRIGGRRWSVLAASWAPTGKLVAVSAWTLRMPRRFRRADSEALDIFIVNAKGQVLRNLTRRQANTRLVSPGSPAWSPDGKWIAFTRGGDLWLAHPDGSGLHNLNIAGEAPTWSTDGRELAFQRYPGEFDPPFTGGIFMMSIGDRQARLVIPGGRTAAWSPDGSKIAYWAESVVPHEGQERDVFVANADGSDPRDLTKTRDVQEDSPAWSPGGKAIAYVREYGFSENADIIDIAVMRADGSNPHRVIARNGGRVATRPTWRRPSLLPNARRARCR